MKQSLHNWVIYFIPQICRQPTGALNTAQIHLWKFSCYQNNHPLQKETHRLEFPPFFGVQKMWKFAAFCLVVGVAIPSKKKQPTILGFHKWTVLDSTPGLGPSARCGWRDNLQLRCHQVLPGGEKILEDWYNRWHRYQKVASWWFKPIWKILVKLEIFPK